MTIDEELRARIRRLFYAEHWKVGTIAAELGVHHETVERAVGTERFANLTRPVRPMLLDPYKDFIQQTLEQHPRLRSTRLAEMIRERGYAGSVNQLRRYVATVRPSAKREAYLRLVTLPGEQAQVDWGHFGKVQIGRAQRPLSCFVLVLSWSRAMYARFALDQTLESFPAWSHRRLRGARRCAARDPLRQSQKRRTGAARRSRTLPPTPARLRRALSLRSTAVRTHRRRSQSATG